MTRFRWFAIGLMVLLAARPAAAQTPIKIAYDEKSEPKNLRVVVLRPNVTQPVFLAYYNDALIQKKNIKVSLEQVFPDGKTRPIGTTTIAKVDARKNAPMAFTLPGKEPVKEPPAKDVKDVKDAPWPKLDGPPFLLRFLIDDGTTETVKVDVPVKIQEPREYVKVSEARFDPKSKKLSFKVSSDELLDPPCPIQLVMQPSTIPGLVVNKAGTFRQILSKENLTKENPDVELSADEVTFEGATPTTGRVYLTVDGYERAFAFNCAFAEGTLTPLADEVRARLVAPRYSLPAAKMPVVVEIDGKALEVGEDDPMQNWFVDVKFDRAGTGTYQRPVGGPFRGLRAQSIEYKADGDAMIFKTRVSDRVVELDTEGINGKRSVQVRVLAKGERVPLANEQDERDGKLLLFHPTATSRYAPLKFDKINDAVVAEVILDGTPAEDLTLDKLPLKTRPEDTLRPRLTVKERGPNQAPIEKVYFFFGEADKHRVPDKAPKTDGVWDDALKAYIPGEDFIVPETRGKLYVSAVVETATGVPNSVKQPVYVYSRDFKEGGDDRIILTTISGTVQRGGRMQPDAVVVLQKVKKDKTDKDEKPMVLKTKDDGKFEFKDVEPGQYVLSAKRMDVVAREPLLVPKNMEKIGGLKLELKVP